LRFGQRGCQVNDASHISLDIAGSIGAGSGVSVHGLSGRTSRSRACARGNAMVRGRPRGQVADRGFCSSAIDDPPATGDLNDSARGCVFLQSRVDPGTPHPGGVDQLSNGDPVLWRCFERRPQCGCRVVPGRVAVDAVGHSGLLVGLAGDSSCRERVEPWSGQLVSRGGGGDVLAREAVGAVAGAGGGGVVTRARFGPAVIPPPVLAAGLATRHRHPRSRHVQGFWAGAWASEVGPAK